MRLNAVARRSDPACLTKSNKTKCVLDSSCHGGGNVSDDAGLQDRGVLKIAEVSSRFTSFDDFVKLVKELGFSLANRTRQSACWTRPATGVEMCQTTLGYKREALGSGGVLKIAEVSSRFTSFDDFVKLVKELGFSLANRVLSTGEPHDDLE
jgi:hypothetical protein